MDNYLNRAMSAYFRFGGTVQPDMNLSGEQKHDDKEYVVLKNSTEILAVYRITTFGQLKRLKRWSKELE